MRHEPVRAAGDKEAHQLGVGIGVIWGSDRGGGGGGVSGALGVGVVVGVIWRWGRIYVGSRRGIYGVKCIGSGQRLMS